jgi:hypothetical protein
VPGERLRGHAPKHGANLLDQRDADGELRRDQLDQLAPTIVASCKRLTEQILEQEHLDAVIAHLRGELVVLILRTLDPQHVVEQQIVVIRRGQSLQTELGSMHHHLPEPAHLRVNAECRHLSSVPDSVGFTPPPPGCRHRR